MQFFTTYSFITIINIISAVACIFIAEKRGGSPLAWFFLGIVFGPLAIIVSLTAGKRCQECYSIIPKEAKKCRYCGSEVN
jgi:uncharacterized membrane protein